MIIDNRKVEEEGEKEILPYFFDFFDFAVNKIARN
jgi:hypothetical protein